jgi:hypothetical protein
MKRLFLVLSLASFLFSACSADTISGPAEGDRDLQRAESTCNPNAQLC